MGNSANITDTNSRLLENLSDINDKFYEGKNITGQINHTVHSNMITTARLVKFYPSINKCLVELGDGSTRLCTINMLMGGGLMFLYTPQGDRSYCDDLHEPCIIPWSKVYCFVAPVNNIKEWVMLGYYYPYDFVGFNPSKKGQFKILAFGSLGEYSIRFGLSGLEIVTNGQVVKTEIDDFGKDVSTSYYDKESVDKVINELSDRIKVLEDLLLEQEEDTNDDGSDDDDSVLLDTT